MQGYRYVRDYVKDSFFGDKASDSFAALRILVQQTNFAIAQASRRDGDRGVMQLLATSDELELGLRRIPAFVYQDRTRDRAGAVVIQGSVPPGSNRDVAPSWLVSDATIHSKNEHQRSERVSAEVRHRATDTKKKGDKGGKGGGKGGKFPPPDILSSKRRGSQRGAPTRQKCRLSAGSLSLPRTRFRRLPLCTH